MRRLAWATVASGRRVFLAAGAYLRARRRDRAVQTKGLMTIPVEEVREVDITAPRGRWLIVRTEHGWRATHGTVRRALRARSSCASIRDRVMTQAEVKRRPALRSSALLLRG
jgi:hypothetical protein